MMRRFRSEKRRSSDRASCDEANPFDFRPAAPQPYVAAAISCVLLLSIGALSFVCLNLMLAGALVGWVLAVLEVAIGWPAAIVAVCLIGFFSTDRDVR